MRYGKFDSFETGVAIPLFSLKTKNSIGIGEFLDLIPFATWSKFCGFNIIQILPVNDTGNESSPYSARSAFALHPVFLNLQSIAGSKEFKDEILNAKQKFDKLQQIDFESIVQWKLSLLRKIYNLNHRSISENNTIAQWIDSNPWIKPYCVYALLKAKNKESSWQAWSSNQNPSAQDIEELWQKNLKEALFHAWMQFEAEAQFKAAVQSLSKLNIKLKGDIPILINEDSADVWYHRHLFSLENRAGAPPDMFSYTGQNWGFPTYHWDKLAAEDYQWWKNRLHQASKFYHAYRIDHVLGFFRIWTIPQKEVTGALGYFNPSIPLKVDDLVYQGIPKETLHYLKNPNYSTEQILSFFDETPSKAVLNEFFELLAHHKDRYIFKEKYQSERAILNSHFEQNIKDALLKIYWNRVFIPHPSEHELYPFWFWHEQAVLKTLPDYEQKIIQNAIYKNAESQENLWQENALRLLSVLKNETDMLVCAEDLGAVPRSVPYVLNKLNILSLRVERWERDWNLPYSPYYDMDAYPRLSVTTTSTHDTSTLKGLWNESDFDRDLFWSHAHQLGIAPESLSPTHIKKLLQNTLRSNSLLCIIPFQDYLGLSAQFNKIKPETERINIPGTIGSQNWSYRIPCLVEDLQHYSALNSDIRSLIDERKQRHTHNLL
jgi:4-alpha-glucanotransferase